MHRYINTQITPLKHTRLFKTITCLICVKYRNAKLAAPTTMPINNKNKNKTTKYVVIFKKRSK